MISETSCYDAAMSSSSSLHEQLADMTLERQKKSQSEQTVLHDFDSNHENSDNKMISSINITRISMLKQKNRTFRTQIHQLQTEISRLRDLRNQYRQKVNQFKREIIELRTQLHDEQKLVLVNSDDEKHKQR